MIQHVTRDNSNRRTRRIAFNARSIARIAPETQPVDWFDLKTPGLALRVTPGGTRTWYAFYQKGHSDPATQKTVYTTRRVKLGTFPAVKLEKARSLARQTRVRVETEGADPAYDRQAARAVFTVGDLAGLYLEQHAKAHKRTWRDDHWRLERYVLSAWKSRPIAEIDRRDVHALLDKIAAAGKPIQANRVQALVSKLWNFAIDRGHATVNPCYRMPKRAPERKRSTVLSDDQIRALWRALDTPTDATDAIKLRFLTGQRGGEVHTMTWADVDLVERVWTIPAERAKNGRAHRVPLVAEATDLLERRRRAGQPKEEARVFPGLYHQREDLRELGAIHNGVYRWHDLRRTVATRLAAIGVSEDLIGRVLNHARRGITATVYNQYAYDAEKRQALEAWACALRAIVSERQPAGTTATVVPIRRV